MSDEAVSWTSSWTGPAVEIFRKKNEFPKCVCIPGLTKEWILLCHRAPLYLTVYYWLYIKSKNIYNRSPLVDGGKEQIFKSSWGGGGSCLVVCAPRTVSCKSDVARPAHAVTFLREFWETTVGPIASICQQSASIMFTNWSSLIALPTRSTYTSSSNRWELVTLVRGAKTSF